MMNKVAPFGVPLRWHPTAIILPLLFIWQLGMLGIPISILLVLSLLAHEYAHVWAALSKGYVVPYVIVHGFGGAAMMDISRAKPRDELEIAVAGPLMSLALAGLGIAAGLFIQKNIILTIFIFLNVGFALFNILPLYPMDGGRILYSLLSMKVPKKKALMASVLTTTIMGSLGILFCLYYGIYWVSVIFALVIFLAWKEKRVRDRVL